MNKDPDDLTEDIERTWAYINSRNKKMDEVELEDGTIRRLGNNAPPEGLVSSLNIPLYGTTPTTPIIPRDKWKVTDLSRFTPPIKDQDGIGACNAFSSCYVFEACRAVQGLPPILLSTGYLYGLINGGRDQGSTLPDAMNTLLKHGTCLASTVGMLDWHSRPPAAEQESPSYRLLELYECPTTDHIASAIQCGFFVSTGLVWGSNYKTDKYGWLPMTPSSGGGHAVMRDSLFLHPDGVTWGFGGPNSWGVSWGDKGRMVISEHLYGKSVGGFWAARQVVDEGGVIPTPAA